MSDKLLSVYEAWGVPAAAVAKAGSVDALDQDVKDEAVELARTILENLRVSSESSGGDKIDFTGDAIEKAELLAQASRMFLAVLANLAKVDQTGMEDRDISALFENAKSAIGKIAYKVRSDIINILVKQGQPQAGMMRAQLEASTPSAFKTMEQPLSQMIRTIEHALVKAATVRRTHNLSKKTGAAIHVASSIQTSYQIVGVSQEGLVEPARQANEEPMTTMSTSKVTSVSKEHLVEPAKQVNQSQEPGLSQNLTK